MSLNDRVVQKVAAARAARRRDRSVEAFIAEPETGRVTAPDDLAELLAEQAIQSATTGDYVAEDQLNEDVAEDSGGPFVETSARTQFASGYDESNIEEAEPAPFPTAVATPDPGDVEDPDDSR